jgi:hypothetical protein
MKLMMLVMLVMGQGMVGCLRTALAEKSVGDSRLCGQCGHSQGSEGESHFDDALSGGGGDE